MIRVFLLTLPFYSIDQGLYIKSDKGVMAVGIMDLALFIDIDIFL
jgi:hypothetical protein